MHSKGESVLRMVVAPHNTRFCVTRRWLLLSLVLGALSLTACEADNPPLTLINDLDFAVTIYGCDGGSGREPWLAAGGTRVITPGRACNVIGPRRDGWDVFLKGGGGYLGCLFLPRERGRDVILKVSEADKDISSPVCHTVTYRPGS